MPQEGLGVERFTRRCAPGPHDARSANASGDWKASAESFADADQVRNDIDLGAREGRSGPTKAGIDLVECEYALHIASQNAQASKPLGVRGAAPASGLDRLDQHEAHRS